MNIRSILLALLSIASLATTPAHAGNKKSDHTRVATTTVLAGVISGAAAGAAIHYLADAVFSKIASNTSVNRLRIALDHLILMPAVFVWGLEWGEKAVKGINALEIGPGAVYSPAYP